MFQFGVKPYPTQPGQIRFLVVVTVTKNVPSSFISGPAATSATSVSTSTAAMAVIIMTVRGQGRVMGAVVVMAVAGPWMLNALVEYLQRTLQAIPGAVG